MSVIPGKLVDHKTRDDKITDAAISKEFEGIIS